MNDVKHNWSIWLGFVLAVLGFLSFPFFFVKFPITRDFPWANLLLFVVAIILVLNGLRRAFSAGRKRSSKIISSIVAVFSLGIVGLFIFAVFIAGRQLPPSLNAPRVGQQAPDFSLPDSTGKTVSLTELRTSPIKATPLRGVLLVFYRGYW